MVCVCHIFISSYRIVITSLIAQRSELLVRRGGVSNRLLAEFERRALKWLSQYSFQPKSPHLQKADLAFEIGLGLDLPLLFEAIHNIFVSPTNLVRQTLWNRRVSHKLQNGVRLSHLYRAVFPARLQP